MNEAAGSRMCCKHIQDQVTLWTQDDNSTVQTMLPLDEITLNRIESCDGCDGCYGCNGCNGCDGCNGCNGCNGHSVVFYSDMRLRQPNNTSTGHVRDQYGQQICMSAGWVQVNSGIIGWLQSDCVSGQLVASQEEWLTYGMIFGYSIRTERVMDCGYLGEVRRHTRNPRGARWLVHYAPLGMWFVTDSRDRRWQLWPSIYDHCGLLYSKDEEALLGAIHCIRSP